MYKINRGDRGKFAPFFTKLCRPLVEWGSTYCFTAVCFGISITPITKGPSVQFFWVAYFLFPRSLAFDFCYGLDNLGQGQALRVFFLLL